MRTKTIELYQFSELTEEAKETAIDKFRNRDQDYSFYYEEIISSCKAAANLLGFKFGREYTDIRTGHIDDNILELTGARLYTYIINNYGSDLFKPKYIECIDRHVNWKAFICEQRKGINGPYTMIYSKNRKDDCCVLTGVCYDNDILQPVYSFLEKPDNSTWEDILQDIGNAIQKTFNDTEEWINSDEYIIETIEANDYEFDEKGNIL